MADLGLITLDKLKSGELSPEILDQLQILNRITFPLKPTSVSAVSQSVGQQDQNIGQPDPIKDIDDMIDHVTDMENLAEQLEDLSDELLKDMNIPPENPDIEEAAKALGSPNGNITKPVLDNALAIIEIYPQFISGPSPLMAILSPGGTTTGPYINCDQFTDVASQIVRTVRAKKAAENVVKDQTLSINKDFDEKQGMILKELILMLWWNILWCKFIVDLAILNPLRIVVANPLDGLLLFFKKACGKGPWRTKNVECLRKEGPLNKAITRLEKFLKCVIPKSLYSRYKPDKSIENWCAGANNGCTPDQEKKLKEEKEVAITSTEKTPEQKTAGLMDRAMSAIAETADFCGNKEDFGANYDKLNNNPTGLGASPACLAHAKKIVDAVMGNALTPKEFDQVTKLATVALGGGLA